MTFRQFAFKNVTRNKRLYVAYFLSSLFTVMVFFTFAIFAFHPALNGEGMNSQALTGMSVAGGIIYVFSFFFILYSMSSFLQSRKMEFGVLMIQGMSSRQIRRMVFLENMLLGFFSILSGIGLGLVFAKAILLIAENVLVIDETLNFYFPTMAIIVTFVSFIVLFLFISLFITFVLRTNKLIHLIKGDKIAKSEPKASIWLTLLAVILLTIGYIVALRTRGIEVFAVMIPVIIVVIIGTYFLFTQLSVFLIGRLKKNEQIFWRKTNMLLYSDLSFRMKDNARTFFLVAIISTVAFSAIGALIGGQSYLLKGMKEANPISFVYSVSNEMDEKEGNEHIAFIEDTLHDEKVQYEKVDIELEYFTGIDKDHPVLIAKQSDYNRFASLLGTEEIDLPSNEAAVAEPSQAVLMEAGQAEKLIKQPIQLADGSTIQVNEDLSNRLQVNVIPELFAYYIVPDHVYEKLPVTSRSSERIIAWQASEGQSEQLITVGEKYLDKYEMMDVIAIDYMLYQVNKFYGPVLFIGLFIGIVFFVSAGSFLYFRLFTDLDDDKKKFTAISKMGLTNQELRKVISQQTMILFFTPIIVALIHGGVALTALSHMLEYDLMKESAIVLGTFFIIQVVYFLIVRFFYTKQIKMAVK